MKRARGRARTAVAGFNMTPMIDVVLQLIIFFLVTSQFSQLVRTPMDLPEQEGEDDAGKRLPAIVVDVRADGVFLIERSELTLDETVAKVVSAVSEARREERPAGVLVRADRATPSRHISELATGMAAAGVRNWTLGTERPGGGG